MSTLDGPVTPTIDCSSCAGHAFEYSELAADSARQRGRSTRVLNLNQKGCTLKHLKTCLLHYMLRLQKTRVC